MIEASREIAREIAHLSSLIIDVFWGLVVLFLISPFIWTAYNFEFSMVETRGMGFVLWIFGNTWQSIISAMRVEVILPIFVLAFFVGRFSRAPTRWMGSIINKVMRYYDRSFFKSLKTQYHMSISYENYHDSKELSPTFALMGTRFYSQFRTWLLANPPKKAYWDWEHFLESVYGRGLEIISFFFVAYFSFSLSYFALYVVWFVRAQVYLLNLEWLVAWLMVILIMIGMIYWSYREYTFHHIAFVAADLALYLDFLEEEMAKTANQSKITAGQDLGVIKEKLEKLSDAHQKLLKTLP